MAGSPSPEEWIHDLVQRIRSHLQVGDINSALAEFNQLHPVDQGEVLVGLAGQPQQAVLKALTSEATAEILGHLEPEEAVEMAIGLKSSILSDVLDEARPDVAADILRLLPEGQSQEVLGAMVEAAGVRPLLEYPDDTAGGLMTSDYFAVRAVTTAANALDQLRLLGPEAENISSVFLVDDRNTLVGAVSVTRLALAKAGALVQEIAERETISTGPGTDQEESARLMERYNLAQLPVVDREGKLIGVILAEDLVDVMKEEATEDMYRLAGVPGERVFGPLRHSLRRRLPWLALNLVTAFLAASVVSLFESAIAKVVALAVFLPVVAGQGGIGGTQSLTLVVRSIALGEVPSRLGRRLLARELLLGLVNGLLLGLVVGTISYAWKGNPALSVVLGLAMVGNLLVAGLTGSGVPLLMRRLGIDPAVSSAVFVTACGDIVGFLLFLGMATAFISFLI